MPMSSAQIAAGIVARFTPHVGGCWKILDLRVRVESRLLQIILSSQKKHKRKRKDAPPLHHDEREEVHALRLIEQIIRQSGGVVTKLQGQRGKRHAVALQVPKRPGHARSSEKLDTF
jgi:hypothetical protein